MPRCSRRRFLHLAGAGALAMQLPVGLRAQPGSQHDSFEDWLAARTVPKETIDRFLDPSAYAWAKFDAELGYLLRNSWQPDGVNGSWTIGHYEPNGERRVVNYADKRCRVHTYGDSFTQCHQVSDGETWQEYLAAHFGEPVHNYGIGGYGVWQAFKRMERVQARTPVKYLVLNIWGDDHQRSLMSSRCLYHWGWFGSPGARPEMFHSNPWTHLTFDLDSGNIVERPNLCPTPQSVYALCDSDSILENFASDPFLQLRAIEEGVRETDSEVVGRLAEIADWPDRVLDAENPAASASGLFRTLGYRATYYILEKAQALAKQQGSKLLVMLTYMDGQVWEGLTGEPRVDAEVLHYLQDNNYRHFDVIAAHKKDFESFDGEAVDYLRQYYIGHYNPSGNFFLAKALRPHLTEWLDPPPPTYREYKGDPMDFQGYLPESQVR